MDSDSNIIKIESSRTDGTDLAFKEFMRLTETEFNLRAKAQPGRYKSCNGKELEKVTVALLKDICPQTPFDPQEIQLVSGQQFPDIIASKIYGVEVKSTEKDQWTSTGSSIVESTRKEGVERIYLLFGKLGSKPEEFKCRPYEDVLYDIAVTHSPRYLIDMELGNNDSIFNKMHTTYDALRTSPDSINQVRQYYIRKAKEENKTSMPWWLESDTQMSIQLWPSVSKEEKEILQGKMCMLFPEILCNLKEKYARVALWLCAKYSILVYNARDCFSAGGQCSKINGNGLGYKVPQVVARYVEHAKTIIKLFESPLEIREEILEFNKEIWDEDKKVIYENWLNQTSKLVCNFAQKNIPFREWFENEVVIS